MMWGINWDTKIHWFAGRQIIYHFVYWHHRRIQTKNNKSSGVEPNPTVPFIRSYKSNWIKKVSNTVLIQVQRRVLWDWWSKHDQLKGIVEIFDTCSSPFNRIHLEQHPILPIKKQWIILKVGVAKPADQVKWRFNPIGGETRCQLMVN